MDNITSNIDGLAAYDTSTVPLIEWSPYYLLLLLVYPLVVALLRYDRLRSTLETFPYTDRRSFASMTDNQAFLIQKDIGELEFPFIFEKALQFALFRTYGIPSISSLLVATAQFSKEATACKRYTDTEVLIREFMGYAPTSERTLEAISRMNYIHSGYQKCGKISNDDMLYTLSLFVAEPIRWIDRYEWRTLEAFEKCAIGTFWKSLGDAMGISFENLPSSNEGWIDGLQWLEEIVEWGQEYEKKHMLPHINNKTTADETINILLWKVPKSLKPAGQVVIHTLMDDRLRKAMMYATPPPLATHITHTLLHLRALLLRYLALPRPVILRAHHLSGQPSKDGTYFALKYVAAPYYMKPTIWNRWGPMAWAEWAMGLPVPGDEGAKYSPGGYRIGEIGPRGFPKVGEGLGRLKETRTGGCPFERVKSE